MRAFVLTLFVMANLGAVVGPRRRPSPTGLVNEDIATLVQAEARLYRTRPIPRDFYPGTYRAPGDFNGRVLRALNAASLDLRAFRFFGADLRAANLYRADLRGADLRGADLRDAVLVLTKLEGARVNAGTQLPISREDARARGVTWSED